MKAIIAVNNLGFIGNENKLLWKCKADLMLFKGFTTSLSSLNILLVGHNTYQGLPRILKQSNDKRHVITDIRGELLNDNVLSTVDWCIGGKKTYEKYQHLFTELPISHINDNSIGDTFMPKFDRLSNDCKIFNYYFDAD